MELLVTVALFGVCVLAVTWLAERLHWSAPLMLMLVGIVGSYLPFVHEPALEPDLVLVGLLPPLLYAAAVNTPLVDFRANLPVIGLLSVGLVLFTAAGVALVVHLVLGLGWAACVAIGAVVAPPDAVAATAVARQVGLPRRVVTILEGESLVNDATALVTLRTAVGALTASVTAGAIALDFVRAVLVALVIGYVVARVAGYAFRLFDDTMLNTALTFLVPFAAYAPAEELHGSGVLAVVVAALVLGHRAPLELGAQARVALRINWNTIQFLLENSVFLLIGLQARRIVSEAAASPLGAARGWAACAAVLATVVVLRIVWVLLTRFGIMVRRQDGDPDGLRESAVISWAGMRGVVTLAAALALPNDIPGREILVLMALVVTIGTLLLQGLTLPLLARRLRVRGPDPREDAIEEAMIIQRSTTAGLRAAEKAAGPDDGPLLDQLRAKADTRVNSVWERLGRPSDEVESEAQGVRRLRLASLDQERKELLKIRGEGEVDQVVLRGVLSTLDLEEALVRGIDAHYRLPQQGPLRIRSSDDACEHLREAPACATPTSTRGCLDCERESTAPVHLRLCLTCGNVGCCDSSSGRHAERHFQESGHPVMRSFEPGESWRWCYVDERVSE